MSTQTFLLILMLLGLLGMGVGLVGALRAAQEVRTPSRLLRGVAIAGAIVFLSSAAIELDHAHERAVAICEASPELEVCK